MIPPTFKANMAASRSGGGGPPQFVPGLTSSEEARKARKLIETRKSRQLPDFVASGPYAWIKSAIIYGAELVANRVAEYLVDELRSTEIFVRNPGFLQPTIDGRTFDIIVGIDAANPVVLTGFNGPWIIVDQFTVPNGNQGVLRWVGHDLSNAAAWPLINWRIMVDGYPVGTYNSWYGQIGTIPNPFQTMYTAIEANQTISLQARNVAFGGALTTTARIGGWHYPTNNVSDKKWETALQD